MNFLIIHNRRAMKISKGDEAPHISEMTQTEKRFFLVETLESLAKLGSCDFFSRVEFDEEGNIAVGNASPRLKAKLQKYLGPRAVDVLLLESEARLPAYVCDWSCDDFLEVVLDYTNELSTMKQAARSSSFALVDILDAVVSSCGDSKVLICSHEYDAAHRAAFLDREIKSLSATNPRVEHLVRVNWLTSWDLNEINHLKELSVRLDNLHRASASTLGLHPFPVAQSHQYLWDNSVPLCDRIDRVYVDIWSASSETVIPPDRYR